VAILLDAHNRVLGAVFWGVGDWKIATFPTLLYAVSNAAVSVLLCLHWGLVGIAAGTTLTSIPVTIWCTIYAIHRFQLSWWEFFGRAWIGVLLGTGVGWLCSALVALAVHSLSFWRLFLQGIFFEVGFGIAMVTVGFTPLARHRLKTALLGWLSTTNA
jgi:peptidoglycan biosynthesis protein MviN/MurJ (putative lipid II flippase)